MAFTIPDETEGQSDLQSIVFQEDFDIMLAGIQGIDCVLSGLAVTAQATPDMTVVVAKGSVLSNGIMYAVAAANGTITAADGTNPRLDLVVITSAGAIAVRAGTAAASPKPPVRTANDVVIAIVYVPASDTTIGTAQITDARVSSQKPITIAESTTEASTNTSTSAVTVMTVTIPDGLFLSGSILRARIWGNYLANNSTPTFTLTISYGGTTIFTDATGATTNDADRGAWSVQFDLIAQGNADQALSGRVGFQTPAGKTAPTTGIAGDLAAATDIQAEIMGAAIAVDSDAADRILLVTWTMSVSHADNEVLTSGYTLELVA